MIVISILLCYNCFQQIGGGGTEYDNCFYILEIIGMPLLFSGQNSPVFIPVILGVVALMIGMMIVYLRIQAKYTA